MNLKIYSDKELNDCRFNRLKSMNNLKLLDLLEEILKLRIFDYTKTINYINTRLFSTNIQFIKLFCEMIEKVNFNDIFFYKFNFIDLTQEYVNKNPELIYEFYEYSLGKYYQPQILFGFYLFKNTSLINEEIYTNIFNKNVNIQKCSIEILNLSLKNNLSIKEEILLDLEDYVIEENYDTYVNCLILSMDNNEEIYKKVTEELNSNNPIFSTKYIFNSLYSSLKINEDLLFKSYAILDKYNDNNYDFDTTQMLYDIQEKLCELNSKKFLEIITLSMNNYKQLIYDNVQLSTIEKGIILHKLNENLKKYHLTEDDCENHINSIFQSKEDIMEWIKIHKSSDEFDKIVLVLLKEISFEDKDFVEEILTEIGKEKNININDVKKHEDPDYSILYTIDRILYYEPKNIEDLNECLKIYPNTNRFVGDILRKSLKKNKYDPHPLVQIFFKHPKKIDDYNKEYYIKRQRKWELIFKNLNNNNITIKKGKLSNINGAEDVLCEIAVVGCLIKNFDIELESKIYPLNENENITNIDLCVKYKHEKIYIEIANLKLDSVTKYNRSKFVSFEEKKYKPFNVLNKKYQNQYHNSNIKNSLPLYYVLYGSYHFRYHESIYGVHNEYEDHKGIFEFADNNINGVFHLDFNYVKDDQLFYKGKLYELNDKPRYEISEEFKKLLYETFFEENY